MKPSIYRLSTLCMAAAIAFISIPAWAQDTRLSTSGDWSVGDNWTAGEPTGTDVAEIGDGLTGQVTESNEVAQTLYIANAGGAGTLEISAGHLAVENLFVGMDTNGNIGTVTQAGGLIDIASWGSCAIGDSAGAGLGVVFADGDGVKSVPVFAMPACEDAWAMTIHKSQGSEFESVALVLGPAGHRIHSRELVYTGITRARRRLSIWAPPQALELAAGVGVARHARLRQRLARR